MYNALTFPQSTTRSGAILLLSTFLALLFFAQLLSEGYLIASIIAFSAACTVLLYVLFVGSRNDLFLFLFITTAMSITIPYGKQRELDLVIPMLFFGVALIRFFPKFLRISSRYLHPLLAFLGVFFFFCLVCVLNNLKIPGVNAQPGTNSGLLNRFNLLNSVITFLTGLILFQADFIGKFISYFFRFYLVVLFVSLVIILFELGTFPFFNTFSWTLIVESEESKKMIIAGAAASFVLIFTLIFLRSQSIFLPLIILSMTGILASGSRTFFAIALLTFIIVFVVKGRVLGKSLIYLAIVVTLAIYLLLSPLILLVPEKYQRLVIIFPPHYYSGELVKLSESAAASSSQFRLKIWTMAAEKIKEKPIFGNSFEAPIADYDFDGNLLEGFQKIPANILYHDFMVTGSLHNTFISIAYLMGIPALLFFLLFFTRLIWLQYRKSLRTEGQERQIAILMVVLLIHYFLSAIAGDIIFDLQFILLLAIEIKVLLFFYTNRSKVNNSVTF